MGKSYNRKTTEEDMQIKKHIIKYSTAFVIRETQIKTTLRCHDIPLRMANIHNADDITCWQGFGTAETFILCW